MDGAAPALGRGEELKGLWLSLFDPVVAEKCSRQEQDLQGISILLGITFSCFKRLKFQYESTKHEYELTKNRLQVTLSDLSKTESELMSKKERPCDRCKGLENELQAQKKKISLNEERMKSIARILNIGSTQKIIDDEDGSKESHFAYAYSVVSQILHDGNAEAAKHEGRSPAQGKATDRVARWQENNEAVPLVSAENEMCPPDAIKFECFDDVTLVPESLPLEKPAVNVVVPETMALEDEVPGNEKDNQSTPKKQAVRNKAAKENRSPVINAYSCRPPGRAGGVAVSDAKRQSSTVKAGDSSAAHEESPSLLQSGEAAHGGAPGKRAQPCASKKADIWVLKPGDGAVSPTRPAGRKLTQTRLSLARLPRKVDVCSTQEFTGGVRHMSTLAPPRPPDEFDRDLQAALRESLEDHRKVREGEDIVLESPNSFNARSLQCSLKSSHARSRSGRQDAGKRAGNDPDETFFPGADDAKRAKCGPESTEELLAELGCSARGGADLGVLPLRAAPRPSDRVPDKGLAKSGMKEFAYHRDAVRGKIARSKLEGWACEDCRELYEGLRLTEAEKKALINECSKHRDKFPAKSTSPSDW